MTGAGDLTADHPPEREPHRDDAPPKAAEGPAAHGSRTSRTRGGSRFATGVMIADRYRVVSLLGRGGMGEVYRAEDLRLGQTVAIKFLPLGFDRDAHRLERLISEVRLAREVAHANVARVYDIGDAAGEHYLTMEFVDGEDLASLIRRVGRPNPEKANEIARQICAGVAALHERGLLHRDLKPANIMLDERGTVRIMDFGLAMRSDLGAGANFAGTPGYMAPEQWTGGELTRATDLYAIGLILFELFTGRSAATGRTEREYREWHTSASREALSGSMSSIDPAVERVIMRCLETDPALRPSSALAVAAMLPGGDPIAAALAAGDTPSPEMVAAAGRAARISPSFALPVGAAFLVALAVWVLLPTPLRPWDFFKLPKSPEVLADRAEQILIKVGLPTDGRGSGRGFDVDRAYLKWLRLSGGAPTLEQLGAMRIGPLEFFLRRSPRSLVADNGYGRVTADDPPFDLEGMSLVKLDPGGRLRSLELVPPRLVVSAPTAAPKALSMEATWDMLFAEAGLDPLAFDVTEPARWPRTFADDVRAWIERAPPDGVPLSVEAAALDGRVVQFSVVGPWVAQRERTPAETPASDGESTSNEDATRSPSNAQSVTPRGLAWVIVSIIAGVTVLMIVLAVRHVRAGRGDLRGAHTIALVVAIVAFIRWLALSDPSVSPGFINAVLTGGAALSLFAAALSWVLYIALEPYSRRVLPSAMITWQRLLQARVTDPVLGRDLLVGSLAGVLMLLAATLGLAIEPRMGATPVLEFGDSWATPWLYGLDGGRRALGLLLLALQTGVLAPMSILLVLVLLRMVLRRTWIAAMIVWIIYAGSYVSVAPAPIIGVVVGGSTAALVLFLIVRYGLVAMLGAQIVATLLTIFPVTSQVSAWYFTTGLIGIAAACALAGFGLWAAVAGRPAPAWDLGVRRTLRAG